MAQHAILSPSKAERWMECPGSLLLEKDAPEVSSPAAVEGTVAHAIAQICLTDFRRAEEFVGTQQVDITVTQEMADYVQWYVDTVREIMLFTDGTLKVEQKLPIETWTKEAGAEGTADAVIIAEDELIIIDLKFGRGVEVDADENKQLMIYGLGALKKYEMLGEWKRVRLIIHQPRISAAPKEFVISVTDLLEFGEIVKARAGTAHMLMRDEHVEPLSFYLKPGEKQCRFCPAVADCPAYAKWVQQQVGAEAGDFAEENDLSKKMAACDMVERWVKEVRARVESELLAGKPVPGWKLVEGRRGGRKWTDEEKVDEELKRLRYGQDERYTYSLISPTVAEKFLKDKPKHWALLQQFITQSEGKPHVAPESDKRPALALETKAEDFGAATSADDFI